MESVYSYQPSEILMKQNEEGGLQASIDTERCYLRSIHPEDLNFYRELFENPITMENYSNGPATPESVANRVQMWVERWKEKNPYSAFAIFLQEERDNLIGHTILGHGVSRGWAEFAIVLKPSYWQNGLGTEVTAAMTIDYPLFLRKENFPIKEAVLEKVTATFVSEIGNKIFNKLKPIWEESNCSTNNGKVTRDAKLTNFYEIDLPVSLPNPA